MSYTINYNVPLDEKYCNTNIRCERTDEELTKYGFTNYHKPTMYWAREVGPNVGFNISINRETRKVEIDILDEDFCQPFDYQSMMKQAEDLEIEPQALGLPYLVHEKVQAIMKQLVDDGILTGYQPNDYI